MFLKKYSIFNRSDSLKEKGSKQGDQAPSSFTPAKLSLCSSPEARACLSHENSLKYNVLPLGLIKHYGRNVLMLAVPEGTDLSMLQSLRFLTGKEIRPLEVPLSVISEAVFKAYNGDGASLESSLTSLRKVDDIKPDREIDSWLPDFNKAENESGKFLSAVINYALSKSASDLHIVPKREGLYLKLRIKGELQSHEEPICSLERHKELIARIKVFSGLDTSLRTKPQDGLMSIPVPGKRANIRVSIMPTVHGEKAVLRFPSTEKLLKLSELGLDIRTCRSLEKFMYEREGMVLFTGPTGSGKTTSMYSVMQELSKENLSLVSIEDPVEIELQGVNQTALDQKTGLDYPACLKSVVRQDPDVILLGEIRDEASAKAAFQAALTGHLVLSTVHARNVFEVILRLKGLGIDPLTVSQALSLIINQRLVPDLCPKCRVVDLQNTNRLSFEVFKPVGCATCDYSGFTGRLLVTESLSLDGAVTKALIEYPWDLRKLKEASTDLNYSSISEGMEKLVREGRIPADELTYIYTGWET